MADESEAVEEAVVSAQKSGLLLESSVVMQREARLAVSSSWASSCSYCAVAWYASSLSVVRSASTSSGGGEAVLESKSATRAARRDVSSGGQNSDYHNMNIYLYFHGFSYLESVVERYHLAGWFEEARGGGGGGGGVM